MKHFTRILTALALGMALFTGTIYSADEKGKANKPVAKSDEELSFELDAAWKRRLPELVLGEGLHLSEVARYIGTQFPEVNFVVPENARDASVPGITLRNVTLSEILKAIELASVGRIRISAPQSTAPKAGPDGLPIPGATAGQNIVAFMASRPATRDTSVAVNCRVFSLSPYLEGRSEKESELAIQQLYQALAVAWEMMKKGGAVTQNPELSIHSGTKLLIAVGRDQELVVIDQVVRQLQGAALGSAPAAATAKSKGRFTVLGEVTRRGTYEIPTGQSISVLQALSKAGGASRRADLKNVNVQRSKGADKKTFHLDVEAMMKNRNAEIFEVMDGDTITVEEKRIDNE